MAETTFTLRVDDQLKTAFVQMAEARDLTAAQLLRALMRDEVQRWHEEQDHGAWFRSEVAVGIRDADDPDVPRVAHDQVVSGWRQQRAGFSS